MRSKLRYISHIVLALFIGYITGSIHAPFKLEWRTTTALPEYMDTSALPLADGGLE